MGGAISTIYRFARRPHIFLLCGIMAFGVFQVFLSLHKYYVLGASTLDLGWYEQTLWKVFHGDWWAFSTPTQAPLLGMDASFTLFPVAYLFHYLGGAVLLFVLQAAATGISAWGIFRAARLLSLAEGPSAIVAGLFLLYPGVIGGSQFDFHVDFLVLPFFIWAYVFYRQRKTTPYYVCLMLAALGKDEATLVVAAWGLGLLRERRWRDGAVALLAGLSLWFGEVFWLLPRIVPGAALKLDMSFYSYLGQGPIGMLTGIFSHFPALLQHLSNRSYYLQLAFYPVAFLPLFGSASLMPVLVLFLFNYLSTNVFQQSYMAEYQVILAGWLFLAMVEGIKRLQNSSIRFGSRLFLIAAIIGGLVTAVLFYVEDVTPMIAYTSDQLPFVQQAVARVPHKTIVYTQNRLGPWVYNHRVFGIAFDTGPHTLADPLSVLWKEGQALGTTSTTILAERPVSPFMAAILAEAMIHGYHLQFHAGKIFLLTGSATFITPAPATTWGWQPRGFPQDIPAWTQTGKIGRVSWRHLWLEAAPGQQGMLLDGPTLFLKPGMYMAVFTFAATDKSMTNPVGQVDVAGQSAVVRSGEGQVRLRFNVGIGTSNRQPVKFRVYSNGKGFLRLSQVKIAEAV